VLPGSGSGSSGPILGQLLAQGQKFALLLDDDLEGRKAVAKYADDWFLGPDKLMTLKSVNESYDGMAIEKLLGQETIDLVQRHLELPGKPSKKQIGWYLSESCAVADGAAGRLPISAIDNLLKILDYFETLFAKNS